MGNGAGDFGPELFRELGLGEDGAYPFANRPIGSFCNTVLFGGVGGRLFVMNSKLLAQICHLLAIFTPAVRPDRFDSPSILLEGVSEDQEAVSHFLCRFGF
jgi:hypothetical protein